METKEVKISVPEGYEFDKENSTFDCIKFKPIKKSITYDDCLSKLKEQRKAVYFETGLTCTSYKQNCKLEAINKLMNVAKYLNEDWKPSFYQDDYKWYIAVVDDGIKFDWCIKYYYSIVYFKSKELAQQAVEILGEDVIKLALSTDW